ncbi:two-component sensor histidine kinase [Nocardiopsis sp. TSRI0078]|uniref:sensor histidine kinase n=1 Tax=unclassified Nocardiopsis TaxID=2649073 RepID=UPI00094027E4|nr:sensor histidine kinase [Nocardiopsis sp. TSRI0078]OKI15236.1 two-component sensor histidine kinase [Nocardiopsis sp. TSRI0078]
MAALPPRPTRADAWITLVLLFLSLGSTFVIELVDPVPTVNRDPWPWGYALVLAACLPVLWRSAWPCVTGLVSVLASTSYYPLGFPDGLVMLCAAVMLYTLVRWGYRKFGWVLGISQFLIVNAYEIALVGSFRPEAVGLIAWVIVLLCAGEVVRWRHEYMRADREREAESTRTREEELLRRASEERVRLARDVHDTVAHNISLINVQAGTALYLMETEPERAAEALATIKQTSKDTLTELRGILGVLRAVDEAAPRSPVPGLDRVEELAEGTRGAGVHVTVEAAGVPGHLPVGTESAAYRAVQESLTNVVRHSGASAAKVRIEHHPSLLVVEVDDDGHGTVGPPVPGNGITGMRERAALVGGTVDAGPLQGGGFRVRARFPLNGAGPESVPHDEETRAR